MDLEKLINVKNRGTGIVCYTLEESGIRRSYSPGETKKNIKVKELEELTYIPGGTALINKYLVINDEEVCEYLGLTIEPEYYYEESTIRTLLAQGSVEQLLDCLDFAPTGVIDLVKKIAIETEVNDVAKRMAIKDKLSLDVTAAIANNKYANGAEETEGGVQGRRATPITENKEVAKEGRRTTPSYNIVNK